MEVNFYLLGLAMIGLHEMDAVRCREWRIFPGLSFLPDRLGATLFLFLHVPLFYWIFWELQQGHTGFQKGFDIFLMAHVGAHILFLWHPKNEFRDWISWTIIVAAGLCGLLDMLIQ